MKGALCPNCNKETNKEFGFCHGYSDQLCNECELHGYTLRNTEGRALTVFNRKVSGAMLQFGADPSDSFTLDKNGLADLVDFLIILQNGY